MTEKHATVEDLIKVLQKMPSSTKVMVLETDFSGYSVVTRYTPLVISEYMTDDLSYIGENIDFCETELNQVVYFGNS